MAAPKGGSGKTFAVAMGSHIGASKKLARTFYRFPLSAGASLPLMVLLLIALWGFPR
jgi:hypothetical protein